MDDIKRTQQAGTNKRIVCGRAERQVVSEKASNLYTCVKIECLQCNTYNMWKVVSAF